MTTRKFQYTDWQEVHNSAWNLGEIIEPVFQPDVIVAIARGGLVVSRIIADYFSLVNLYTVSIEYWGTQVFRAREPQIIAPLSINLEGYSVLVVDEIASSGYSLNAVKRHVYDKGSRMVKTAVLLCITSRNKIKPDFCVKEYTGECWFTYPWTITEDLRHITEQDEYIRGLCISGDFLRIKQHLLNEYDLDLSEKIVKRSFEKICNSNKVFL